MTIKAPASIVLVGAVLVAMAGCGGSSSSPVYSTTTQTALAPNPQNAQAQSAASMPSTSGQQAAANSGQSAAAGQQAAASSAQAQTGRSLTASGRTQKGRSTRAEPGEGAGHANSAINPCSLVTVAEAQAITGKTITGRTEAPLGPTCIYKLAGKSTANVTLVVEFLRSAQLAPQVAKARKLTVARHPAYCVNLGTQMLLVQLSGDRVLNVTASCPVAQRLAAAALKRLPA